jgi:hypothetical protein
LAGRRGPPVIGTGAHPARALRSRRWIRSGDRAEQRLQAKSNPMAAIEIRAVDKAFGTTQVLHAVDLDVAR